jgi:NADH:ubiquinone oxidoreductase subunit 2 (subunit N)
VATGRAHPVRAGLFVLRALSPIGVPPLPGFWAKYLLLKAALGTGDPLYFLAVAAVLVATVVEAAYLFRLAAHLFAGSELPARARAAFSDLASTGLLVAVLAAFTLALVPAGAGLERAAADLGVSGLLSVPVALGPGPTVAGG